MIGGLDTHFQSWLIILEIVPLHLSMDLISLAGSFLQIACRLSDREIANGFSEMSVRCLTEKIVMFV